jgi:hypothetical protein
MAGYKELIGAAKVRVNNGFWKVLEEIFNKKALLMQGFSNKK